ncbi:AAA family ATPase [Rhizobium sp. 10PS4]|uniref:AAA family ATPase n=1 Tax=Rhizobium sp. 10PS4 TaxID=3075621 RepID=UPI0028FDBFE7|nr:AAA family ATPase [Rhizobium sp. 10PS4]MDU0305931.1 AAA family ATPase [Rhizobium sp. 10PS4]
MTVASSETPEAIAATLRKRAAVVGTFDPMQLLATFAVGERDETLEDQILSALSASIEEVVDNKEVLWRLQPEARRDALRELVGGGELDRTITDTIPRRGDRFGQILQAILKKGGGAVGTSMRKMSTDELMFQALALDFARSLPLPRAVARAPGIDPRILLARQAERRRQDYVAPKKLFGRERDAEALDRYIADGALVPPLARLVVPTENPPRLRPLLLTGIGGSGKSALVADLMRRTQRADWSGPIVVCLDFDQRNVALGGEREWLNELTRQIGFARPELDAPLSKIRSNARLELHRLSQLREAIDQLSGTDNLFIISSMRDELQKALSNGELAAQTLVIIVDTFEEVLVRSDMRAVSLVQEPFGLVLTFIDSLTRLVRPDGTPAFGAVRSVVAGRADPFPHDESMTAQWFDAHREVGELDIDAAVELLHACGGRRKFTESRARRIVEVIPRFPLVLTLLATFARDRNARDIDAIIAEAEGAGVLGAAASTRVLYSRFLDRLKDHVIKGAGGERLVSSKDLARLAHPGLALSIITPDLIRNVLAVPTGLGEIDEQKAQDLFDALSREVWLVEQVGPNAVRHIPVLRRIMLPMLNGDLTLSENANIEMRETVRQVHRAAAQWYRSGGGGGDPNASALAAYHDAFLGEISVLVSDPSLVRRVLDVAGDDISAMPVNARAVLRREARSDEGLSAEETAALPASQRSEVSAVQQSRRAKSGITSRLVDLEDDNLEQKPLRSSFELAPVPPGNYPRVGHVPRRQIDVLRDKETAEHIQAMYVEADFENIVKYGSSAAALLCECAQEEPPFDKLADTTNHWTWKWALSCLATGTGDEAFLKWAVADVQSVRELSNATPFRIGTLLSLAIATVALGRAPTFWDEPPYRDAIRTYPRIERSPVTSVLSLRLRVLANYWDNANSPNDLESYELRPDIVRLVALLSPTTNFGGSMLGSPSSVVKLPEELLRRLEEFQRAPPLSSDLKMLDQVNDSIFFYASRQNSRSWQPQLLSRPVLGSILRGRSPEIYDPVRAALGDAMAVDASSFVAAVAEVSEFAPFWPTDCMSDLFQNGRSLREDDYLLARLVIFIDQAGLTSEMFSALARYGKFGRRFQAVAKLVQAYDHLLLAPYRDGGLFPFTHSTDEPFSGNVMS